MRITTPTGNHAAMTSGLIIGIAERRTVEMTKPKAPQDARSDEQNANKGIKGTNPLYDKAQGNRGKQLD